MAWQTPNDIYNVNYKFSRYILIQCGYKILQRKPDIVVIDKKETTCIIIDSACPGDDRFVDKRKNYDSFNRELYKLWSIRRQKDITIKVLLSGKDGYWTSEVAAENRGWYQDWILAEDCTHWYGTYTTKNLRIQMEIRHLSPLIAEKWYFVTIKIWCFCNNKIFLIIIVTIINK